MGTYLNLFSWAKKAAKTRHEFRDDYESLSYKENPLQHCYEIIRENCPCKLYMDVEVIAIAMGDG